jgi:hypothetical protein
MNRKVQLKIFVIFLFSAILHLSAQPQNRKYVVISGVITAESNNNREDKSSVQIIKNNDHPVSFQIPDNNRFRLELEYNTEYKLIFTKNGNQPKTIVVNTEVSGNTIADASNFTHLLMTVNLLADKKALGHLNPQNQVQYVSYSSKSHCFARTPTVFDVNYVAKENSGKNPEIQIQEEEAKLQSYQTF